MAERQVTWIHVRNIGGGVVDFLQIKIILHAVLVTSGISPNLIVIVLTSTLVVQTYLIRILIIIILPGMSTMTWS